MQRSLKQARRTGPLTFLDKYVEDTVDTMYSIEVALKFKGQPASSRRLEKKAGNTAFEKRTSP
jgi:hypothetical protein